MEKRCFHFCLSVRGALKNRDFSGFSSKDGSKLSKAEIEDYLLEQLSQGREFIPMGKCDNFDFKKGCLGHEE